MKALFLILLISTAWAQDPAAVEEEKRKAAEVLGATYTPTKPDEALIDFAEESPMNDEEKEAVMANYERTKNEYKEDAGDTLFEKISKAYVRNLDRVLVKKKPE